MGWRGTLIATDLGYLVSLHNLETRFLRADLIEVFKILREALRMLILKSFFQVVRRC